MGTGFSSLDQGPCDRRARTINSTCVMVNKTKKQKQRQKQALGQAQQVADKPAPGASTQGNQPLPISPDELASGLSTLMITQKPARVNIVQAWDDYFGQGTLEDWARLCRDLGLEGDFSSKTKCKKVVYHSYPLFSPRLSRSPSVSLPSGDFSLLTDCGFWSRL